MSSHDEIAPLLAAYEMKLLSPERQAEVAQHISQCDLCFEDAYSFSPVAEQLLKTKTGQPVKQFSPLRRLMPLALAACLMTVVAAGLWIFKQTLPPAENQTRGAGAIELISPGEGQTVVPPVTFRWKSQSAASFYRFQLGSERETLADVQHLDQAFYVWRPDASLPPGEYSWKIEAFLSDGTKISASEARSFVFKGK